eukprot:COSAG01_NODE_7214_length_3303_cov_2.044944_1_plen_702_part_10
MGGLEKMLADAMMPVQRKKRHPSMAAHVGRRRTQSPGNHEQNVCHSMNVLTASTTHQFLLFNSTRGYENGKDCNWRIQCNPEHSNEAVYFKFIDINLPDCFDKVTLFDGASERKSRVIAGPLCDHVHNPGIFGTKRGSLLVSFTSPFCRYTSGLQVGGFSAEFWCGAQKTVGCTDSSAGDFSAAAVVDDGSCTYDTQQKTWLQHAFVGHEHWDARGWSPGANDPCAGEGWLGVAYSEGLMKLATCNTDHHFDSIDFTGLGRGNVCASGRNLIISGELGPTLGNLIWLKNIDLHGTQLSGTLPTTFARLEALLYLDIGNTKISGTLPDDIGSLAKLVTLELGLTALSGTLPASVSKFHDISTISVRSVHLSGTLPAMASCTSLLSLDVANNSFVGLPSSLPTSLSHVFFGNNPLRGTVANLSRLLGSLVSLDALSLSLLNLPMSIETQGGDHTKVQQPTDCRVGSDAPLCSFTLYMTDASGSLVRTGGLVEELTMNYTDLTSCLPIGPPKCDGSLVEVDNLCADYGFCSQASCEAHGLPWLNHSSICDTYSNVMVDNHDGTFTATVNQSWISTKGPHTFQFFSKRYCTCKDSVCHTISECHYGMVSVHPTEDISGKFLQSVELRTVQFAPRLCPDHSYPDTLTGSICICERGFVQDSGFSQFRCRRQCDRGTVLRHSGDGCECPPLTYNTTLTGILLCIASQI